VLVVGANLAVDHTLRLRRLVVGQVLRAYEARLSGGGKAVNVCRAARAHRAPAVLVANLSGRLGALLDELLAAEGLDVRAVHTRGETRAAIVVLEDGGRTTVVNEPGPPLSVGDSDRLLAAVASELNGGGHRTVVAAGSLPPDAPGDLYGRVVDLARAHGARSVVDTSGAALRCALERGPDLVCPNLAEADRSLRGGSDGEEPVDVGGPHVPDRAIDLAGKLVAAGAHAAFVTAGRHGLGGHDGTGTFWVDAPDVTVRNPIGAGDALVGGASAALERGGSLREAAAVGVASASASVTDERAGEVPMDVYRRLRPGVLVQPR